MPQPFNRVIILANQAMEGRKEVIYEQGRTAINAVFGAIEGALAKGDSVQLIGFGTFGVKERSAREGRNPRTGEVVAIPASKAPYFKAGKALKDKVAK